MQKYILFVHFKLEVKERSQFDALHQIERILKFYGGKFEYHTNFGIQDYDDIPRHIWKLAFVANSHSTRQLLKMLLASKDIFGYTIVKSPAIV